MPLDHPKTKKKKKKKNQIPLEYPLTFIDKVVDFRLLIGL